MKTAEEIVAILYLDVGIVDAKEFLERVTPIIKQHELDSFKAGERFAAEKGKKVLYEGGRQHEGQIMYRAILNDAENRTTLPEV